MSKCLVTMYRISRNLEDEHRLQRVNITYGVAHTNGIRTDFRDTYGASLIDSLKKSIL
jgi:hypothetical protein